MESTHDGNLCRIPPCRTGPQPATPVCTFLHTVSGTCIRVDACHVVRAASRRVVFFGFARDRGSKQASHVKTEGCKKTDKQKESKAYAWLLIFTSLFLFELGTPRPMAAMNWAQVSFDDPDTLVEEGEGRLVGMQCPPAPRLGPMQDPPLPASFELPPQWTSFHFHPYLGKIPVLTNILKWVGSTTNQQIMK